MTTTRTAELLSSWEKMLVSPSSRALLSALRFSGRFMVTVAIPSLSVQRISSAMRDLLVSVLRVHLSVFSPAGQGEGGTGGENTTPSVPGFLRVVGIMLHSHRERYADGCRRQAQAPAGTGVFYCRSQRCCADHHRTFPEPCSSATLVVR